ncbi:MAG: ABC transporter ATP-binding protein [Candidatus Rokubacteria bacterium]|nr:ABC transporter ATP-binding protein [Candidatus Rokubacteria bacterium]
MLEVRDLEARYGRVTAVRGVSLDVKQGEIVCVIGPNGVGKTTTLLTLVGLVRATRGSVTFEGQSLLGLTPDRVVRRGVALVPEGRWVLTEMTVLENLQMGAYSRSDDAEVARDLDRVYELFPILRERKTQLAGTLSGGQQQMLAIGRALMARPRLLLMDEPSLGIAPLVIAEIFRTIHELRARGTTILLVEQNAHQALAVADRAYVMELGRVVLSGPAAELREHDVLRKAYLGSRASAR